MTSPGFGMARSAPLTQARTTASWGVWAVIRLRPFIEKKGTAVPQRALAATPSPKPRFIGPLAKPNFGFESVVNRPPAITADIMLQPKRVADCPIDFTKDV